MAVAAVQTDDGVDAIDGATLLTELLERPAWHADAACRGHDTDAFFPPRGGNRKDAKYGRAVRTCRSCPVRVECLTFALDRLGETLGIWGATGEKRRRQARARGLDARAVLAEIDARR